eukprot:7577999-Alexandrium_andersonii.AAC.1
MVCPRNGPPAAISYRDSLRTPRPLQIDDWKGRGSRGRPRTERPRSTRRRACLPEREACARPRG